MKSACLLFLTLVTVVFLGFLVPQARADDTNGISIQNISVQPYAAKVGNTLTVTATLVNNSTAPIFVSDMINNDCQGPFFTVSFDTHVRVAVTAKDGITCSYVGLQERLDPGKKYTGTSPGLFFTYTTTRSGTANVTVTFPYEIKNQTDPNQSNIEQTISKSFIFGIDSNTTLTTGQNYLISSTQHIILFKSPLQQLRDGINPNEVKCDQGLQLIFKLEDMSPICAKPDTVKILIDRNWATPIPGITFGAQKTHQQDNSSSALKLYLSSDSDVINPGQPVGITISLKNTISKQVTVHDENSWNLNDLGVNPCMTAPYGIAIFDGFYSLQNITEGKPLQIFSNLALCPVLTPTPNTYVFEPLSGHVTTNGCTNGDSSCLTGFNMGEHFSISGTWNYGQILPFMPGTYTIAGGDEWGHVTIQHFVVTNPKSISMTPENSQTIGINKNNGIVTGTRIIDINMNNFHQSRSPLVIQVYYPNDALCRIDKISSTSIQPDGFYKYNFTMSSSDANSVYGNHRIIMTYNNQTVETIASISVPP
jgi:hypothetical protein